MSNRKFSIKKSDIVVISLIALVALGLALFYFFGASGGGRVAVISVNGETLREVNLDTAADTTFALDSVPVSFEVQNHRIRFVSVTCPDHLCENTGFISRAGESAICMPNKTAVVIR